MKKTYGWTALAALLVAGAAIFGPSASAEDKAAAPASAVCVLTPTANSKTSGVIKFVEDGGKIKVTAHVEGLNPGQEHAFHIHEFGDITSTDGKSTGGHYNPEGHDHGLPATAHRHAGDLGNLKANDKGIADYEITVENITINGAKNAIIGRGVIVHAKADDGGQPTGNAGDRIAHGVIGIQGPPPAPAK